MAITRVAFTEAELPQAKVATPGALVVAGSGARFAGSHGVLFLINTVTNATAEVTITGVDDEDGRGKTVTATLAASGTEVIPFRNEYWADTDGEINVAGPTTVNGLFVDMP